MWQPVSGNKALQIDIHICTIWFLLSLSNIYLMNIFSYLKENCTFGQRKEGICLCVCVCVDFLTTKSLDRFVWWKSSAGFSQYWIIISMNWLKLYDRSVLMANPNYMWSEGIEPRLSFLYLMMNKHDCTIYS